MIRIQVGFGDFEVFWRQKDGYVKQVVVIGIIIKGSFEGQLGLFWSFYRSDENRIYRNGGGCLERFFIKERVGGRISWQFQRCSQKFGVRVCSVGGWCGNRVNRYRSFFFKVGIVGIGGGRRGGRRVLFFLMDQSQFYGVALSLEFCLVVDYYSCMFCFVLF